MEKIPGVELRSNWMSMAWEKKEELVRRLAKYQAQLFEKRFPGTGNIYLRNRILQTKSGERDHSAAEDFIDLPATHTNTDSGSKQGQSATSFVNTKDSKDLQNRSSDTVNSLIHQLRDTDGNTDQPAKSQFMFGRIVAPAFFWNDHLSHDASRGPFKTVYDWIRQRLQFTITHWEKEINAETSDEDDTEYANYMKETCEMFLTAFPLVFPPSNATNSKTEPCVLFHHDLSERNILVDDDGDLTGIVDWEHVSAVPLWDACLFPKFLCGPNLNEKPDMNRYASADECDNSYPDLDSEGLTECYWEDLIDYEQTQLRKVFMQEMVNVKPEWVEVNATSILKANYSNAIQYLNGQFGSKRLRLWIEAILAGTPLKRAPLGLD